MQCLKTKFHADTIGNSKVIRSTKVNVYYLVKIYCHIKISCITVLFL